MTTSHPPPDSANAFSMPPGGKPAPRWTILLVDDEPDILSSFQLLLERSKQRVKVITASSGAEGLKILANTHVDLVISDFKMPIMDGIEFLVKAHAVRPEVPRIMCTAYADPELTRRAFTEAFVNDFISKALGPRELVAKVEALLVQYAESAAGHHAAAAGAGTEGVAS